jgi:Outer membrane protein beta-barrel domain
MKKSLLSVFAAVLCVAVMAQDAPPSEISATVSNPKVNLSSRANDHFMIQLGYAGWSNMPDSIKTSGLARTGNVYFMFDFPFKTNNKLSVAIGAGIGTDNIYFSKTGINMRSTGSTMTFSDLTDTSYFKKYKLTTAFLEAPIELRYVANPGKSDKSFKFAIGAKIGTLLGAKTKGKKFYDDVTGNTLEYTEKVASKRFFSSNRLAVMGRVGYGNFSVFGTYQVNAFIKEGVGPDVRPFSIGLTFSGL